LCQAPSVKCQARSRHVTRFIAIMDDPRRKDRPIHLLAYIMAGAAMGGVLDVAVFGLPTPLYGMAAGALIAVMYYGALLYRQRRRN